MRLPGSIRSFHPSLRGGRAALTVGLLSVAVVAAAAAPAAACQREDRAPRYYLALGDSLAAGVQPSATGQNILSGHGYADLLSRDFAHQAREEHHRYNFVDLGCPGETTGTMLNGGCPFPHPYNTQEDAAVAFLQKHHGDRIVVTLDIGANNVDGCVSGSSIDLGCVTAGIASAGVDLNTILTRLQAAAGPKVSFFGMNLYDPFLAAWLTGAGGMTEAAASVKLADTFNGVLESVFAAHRVPVADVAKAFSTDDMTTLVPFAGTSAPLDVVRICQLTWMCAPAPQGPNIHANNAGYRVIEDAFERVLDRR